MLLWWLFSIITHFDPRPRLWLTSLGLSVIIGAALILSTLPSSGATTQTDTWIIFRLFLMPFCVSSFAALVKDAGYILVFPPSLQENAIGITLITAFLLTVQTLKKLPPHPLPK